MDTKTTEWEERYRKEFGIDFSHEHDPMVCSEDCELRTVVASGEHVRDFITSLLHQSRTELMREVVGRVKGLKWDIHGCQCAAIGKSDTLSALIKLAEDEKIKLE